MEDAQIIDLYFERDEEAIRQTEIKYGAYLMTIATNILRDEEDCKECVNDSYFKLWSAIPPTRPQIFKAFAGRITRNQALNMYEAMNADRRGNMPVNEVIDEMAEVIPDALTNVESEVICSETLRCINDFLAKQSAQARIIFVRRYWYMISISDIATALAISESKVKMTLKRMRDRLADHLAKEGVNV